ncbi:MAG: pyridoxal-phosphate dependent enzyme [Burkholderiaceae bacterium]
MGHPVRWGSGQWSRPARNWPSSSRAHSLAPVEVVHASASGGMHVGLWIASRLHGAAAPRSVMIVREIYDDVPAEYRRLLSATLRLMKLDELLASYKPNLDWSAVGPGYGLSTIEAEQAAALLASTEGILVDTVYTGKALGALVRRARQGHRDPVVFWHSGGCRLFLSRPRFATRPKGRH